MIKETLTEREFELVNIVGAEIANNQRDISHHMDLSLGTINMLIRRLMSKGYIRIEQLNQRKVKYILTPKGFAEKMRKSVKYTLKTLNSITLIKERLKEIITDVYNSGERNFYVLGESDLALLVERAFEEAHVGNYQFTYIKEIPATRLDGTVFICKEDIKPHPENADNSIDLIMELSKDHQLVGESL